MKNKTVRILLIALIILAIVGITGAYIYDVYANGTPIRENVFKVASLVFALLGTLVKLLGTRRRRGLDFYEKGYADEMGQAFTDRPKLRKKFVYALRFYNESNYKKAMEYLTDLYQQAKSPRDALPVMLFIALCYSDAGYREEAVKVYYQMIEIDHRNARVHSNLGFQLMELGDFSLALQHFDKSVEYNPENYFAYINRANCYFKQDDYENAEKDALRALEIRGNGREAASLLAILAAIREDEEAKKKYTRIYVNNGGNAEELRGAIEHYMSAEV